MYQRIKLHIKTGIAILVFSLIVTTVFTSLLLWYRIDTKKVTLSDGSVYLLSSGDYKTLIETNGNIQINMGQLIKTEDYQSQILNIQLKRLLPVSLIFLTILFLLSITLWSILKRIQKKQTLKIAMHLNQLTSEPLPSDDPILTTAYDHLKQKFETGLKDYKRLSAYLTHEQKNAVAILRTKLELSKNEEYLKNLDSITDSIDDILTLSETVDTSPIATVDVAVICAEVIDNYRKIEKNIFFEYNGEEDTEILARSRWIYRAIANLLDNAIKYGNGLPIHLSVKLKYHSVIVAVSDQGIGMEEAKQEKIFRDRYRINELNKDGYGIGLSLVAHVCDLCNGFITVESSPNHGSTFYLSFPQKDL